MIASSGSCTGRGAPFTGRSLADAFPELAAEMRLQRECVWLLTRADLPAAEIDIAMGSVNHG